MIIILYVMDSLRADFLSCYGYEKETSPHIDEMAQESVLFTNAFAQSTWTRASGASLLSSTYPSVHHLCTVRDALPVSIPILSEELKAGGFKTIALTTMGNISPFFGFGRGFNHFIEIYKERTVTEKRQKIKFKRVVGGRHFRAEGEDMPIVNSEDINHFLLPFLEENKGGNIFVFVWSLDTHDPYFHRDPNIAQFYPCTNEIWLSSDITKMHSEGERENLKAIYADMIYHNDFHLGVLIRVLKEMNLFDQTLFILTADHGESFGEHGVNSHGGAPYDELIRVPLIMKFPSSQFYGKVKSLVQHIDIVPTILESAHVAGDGMLLQGKSLYHLLREKEEVNHFVFTETQLKIELPKYIALRNHDYKYIEAKQGKFRMQRSVLQTLSPLVRSALRKKLFFYVREDPLEKVNILNQRKEMVKEFRLRAQTILKDNKKMSPELKEEMCRGLTADEEVAKQLKAMGYFD
jgi:arylsulfatase A-like enzyme